MKFKNLAFGVLTIGLSILAVVVVLEGAIRLFAPREYWNFREATAIWQTDPLTGWVQKANLDISEKTDFGWTVHFQTNGDGLAPPGAQRLKAPGKKRIMIFGDSTVVGRAVPQDKTVTAYLQQCLAASGVEAEVINCGVEGYATDQVLLRMQQLVPLYRPDLAFYCLCDNDFGGNFCIEEYGWPKPLFKLLPDGSLKLIPPNLEKRGEHRRYASLLQYSALYRFLQPAILTVRARLGNWEERNLLGLAPEMFYSAEEMDRIDWRLFTALLKGMKQVCAQNGAQFNFYTHPSIGEVWQPVISETEKAQGLKPGQYDRLALEKRLQQVAGAENLVFIPLVPYFLAHQSEGPFHLLPRDPHCNPTGYRLTAEVLATHCLAVLSRN